MPASPSSSRTLLLDALGTLLALEPPAPRLRTELAERFGLEVSEDEAAAGIRAEIAYYRRHLNEGRDTDSLLALRRRCAEELRAALPPSPGRDAIETAALTEALLSSLRFHAYSDAEPALREARSRGWRPVVLSNWDVSLAGVLDGVGLSPLLEGVVTAAGVGAGKPHPEAFARALAVTGARPDQALHVGDSLEEDVAGARAAGIEVVLVRRDGNHGPAGVRTISTLSELFHPGA